MNTMQENNRNIYQIPREAVGYTQEKAAELLDVSVSSLQDYEGDRRRPPDSVVVKMIEVYNCPYLAIQHLKSSPLGQAMPDVEHSNLPVAVLTLLNAVRKFTDKHHALLDITCDGKIEEHEQEEWDEILGLLEDVVTAAMGVQYAKQEE